RGPGKLSATTGDSGRAPHGAAVSSFSSLPKTPPALWRHPAIALDNAETGVDVELGRWLRAAAGTAAVLRVIRTRPPHQTPGQPPVPDRVLQRLLLIDPPAILAPLPDVAVDVVQAPGIALEAPDRGREVEAIRALDRCKLRKTPVERGIGNVPHLCQLLRVVT